MSGHSLRQLLADVAAARPGDAAILGPGYRPLSYAGLIAQIDRVADALAGRIASDARVALVAPDSAAVAVAWLALMACRPLAPLDARLTREELAAQFGRIGVRLVVVDSSTPPHVRAAADDAGVPVVALAPDAADAMTFALDGLDALPVIHAQPDRPRGGRDVAIVACTSGTTGSPKLVPLSHDNVLSMMLANVDVLALAVSDRGLNCMPLCHIHGSGAVLSALLAGGSVAVLPAPFGADAFLDGVAAFAPTWYTAVPTIHATILDRTATRADVVAGHRLRMVRSGSAPMPAGLPERIEATWRGARYVEASGATEASAYLCSNRPETRRIGSVGRAMPGVVLRIVDEAFHDVAPGEVGELVARGPGVFDGYEDAPPELRASAFTPDGEFRTGDLARADADGFVYLVGRLKEQINRGGMKVSPLEVEAALLAHPAVAQAAAFGVDDARLGQEVGACVVLRPDTTCTAIELQRHAASRLADFKVPRHLRFVDKIPVGARGKVERLRLAKQLGLDATFKRPGPHQVPQTPIEQAVAAVWSDVLGGAVITDVDAAFFQLGGDSTQALRVCLALESRFGRPMPLAALGARPTIRGTAQLLADDGWRVEPAAPIVLREGEPGGATLFVLPGVGGNVYNYHPLARHLPVATRVVGLPLPGADGLEPPPASMSAIVDRYVAHVRALAPRDRPVALVGYSFGGRVAHEVASRLRAGGLAVGLVGLIDARGPAWPPPPGLARKLKRRVVAALGARRRGKSPIERTNAEIVEAMVAPQSLPETARDRARAMAAACDAIGEAWFVPPGAAVGLTLFRAEQPTWTNEDLSDRTMGWRRPSGGTVRVVDVPGSHVTMLHEPHVATLAARVREAMEGASAT